MSEPTTKQPRRTPDEFRPFDETRAMLARQWRTRAEWVLWINRARAMCLWVGMGIHWADDLLQETITLIGEGKRRWPKDLDWHAFFYGTMRSVLDRLRKQEHKTSPHKNIEGVPSYEDVEQAAIYDQLEVNLEATMSGDEELLRFHRFRRLGYDIAEIGAKMKLNPQRLEALRKKHERFVRKWAAEYLQRTRQQ